MPYTLVSLMVISFLNFAAEVPRNFVDIDGAIYGDNNLEMSCNPFTYKEEWSHFGDTRRIYVSLEFSMPVQMSGADVRVSYRVVSTNGSVVTNWSRSTYWVGSPIGIVDYFEAWDGYNMYGVSMPSGNYMIQMYAEIVNTYPYYSACVGTRYDKGFAISIV